MPMVPNGVAYEIFSGIERRPIIDKGGDLERHVSEVVQIPADADTLTIIIHRGDMPARKGRALKLRVDLSVDGGVTWSPDPDGQLVWPWGYFPIKCVTASGDSLHPLTGEPILTSTMYAPLPDIGNPSRKARVEFVPLKMVKARVELLCEKRQ